jgi:hypothetical protein
MTSAKASAKAKPSRKRQFERERRNDGGRLLHPMGFQSIHQSLASNETEQPQQQQKQQQQWILAGFAAMSLPTRAVDRLREYQTLGRNGKLFARVEVSSSHQQVLGGACE